MTKVFHYCKKSAAAGNRVHSQYNMVSQSEIIIKSDRAIFDKTLLENLLSSERVCFIFHETGMLFLLLFWRLAYSVFGNSSATFVYDAHDLVELNLRKGHKHIILFFLNRSLLKIVSKLDGIKFMTVSKGLKKIYENKYSVEFFLVYSIPTGIRIPKTFSKIQSKRLIYFGQINQDRIDIEHVRFLSEKGYSIDLYGTEPKSTETSWFNDLLNEVRKSGGEFKGRYDPNDLSFLRGYDFSLMLFRSSANIRNCMPNKLFQSLGQGLPIIVDGCLEEVVETFSDTGAVVDVQGLVSRIDVNIDQLRQKICSMADFSKGQFLEALK